MKNKLSLALAILLTGLFLAVGTFAQETGTTTDEKTAGTVRIGLAGVKTGAIGGGVNAAELAVAIQNALPQYLKGTKVEIVALEAKLPTALDAEAGEKECNYVLYATISHKKGGGGFGMFKKIAPVLGNEIPMAAMAGIAGPVAGTVASTAINSAANKSFSHKFANGSRCRQTPTSRLKIRLPKKHKRRRVCCVAFLCSGG